MQRTYCKDISSIPTPVTNVEVIKTTISFLALEISGKYLNSNPFYYSSNKWTGFGLFERIFFS